MLDPKPVTWVHRVNIPATMRHLTDGKPVVEIDGINVRQVIHNLDVAYPGFADLLLNGDVAAPGVAVAVNGNVTGAILKRLEQPAEIHFVPAMGGG